MAKRLCPMDHEIDLVPEEVPAERDCFAAEDLESLVDQLLAAVDSSAADRLTFREAVGFALARETDVLYLCPRCGSLLVTGRSPVLGFAPPGAQRYDSLAEAEAEADEATATPG